MIKRGIPYLKIEAKDNSDFGYKLGKALRENIQNRLEKNKEFYRKKSYNYRGFDKFAQISRKFIPIIEKHFPYILEEARAMADGANVPFEELFVLMSDEEIIDFKVYPLHCTSVAVKTTDNRILVSHNEDWFPEYRNNGLVLVNGKIKQNHFLGLGYIGSLVGTSCGINSHGIAYTDNSLVYNKFDYGVPRSFHLRALLEAKNPKEAKKILDTSGSVVGSTIIAWSNKLMMDIEELWTKDEIFRGKDWLIHTNHPLKKKDQTNENTMKESLLRYNMAKEILLKEKQFNIQTLKKIQKEHKTDICCHYRKNDPESSTVTIAGAILNPKDK